MQQFQEFNIYDKNIPTFNINIVMICQPQSTLVNLNQPYQPC